LPDICKGVGESVIERDLPFAVGTGGVMKIENENDEIRYVKTSQPDKEELIRLINVGKGEGRSMEKYAGDCNRSPASFSRIVHGGFQRPLSEKLIRDIVYNSGGRLTLDQMMRANGMVPVEEVRGGSEYPKDKTVEDVTRPAGLKESDSEKKISADMGRMLNISEQSVQLEMDRSRNRERLKIGRYLSFQISDIIQEYLYERDYKMRGNPTLPLEYYDADHERYGLSYRTDIDSGLFALHVEGYEPRYWYFIASTLMHKNVVRDGEVFGARTITEVFMSQYARFFLKDLWEPEMMRGVRITFVLTEREIYEALRDSLKDRRVNGFFSLLLVDIKKNRVEDEFIISRMDGKKEKSLFAPSESDIEKR